MKKILIADDDMVLLKLVDSILSSEGFTVVQARNGREAVSLAKSEKPDLLILDVGMPEMDGPEAAEQLQENPATADIPAIFLSSILSKEEEQAYRDRGGKVILAKPVNREDLISEVKTQLSL